MKYIYFLLAIFTCLFSACTSKSEKDRWAKEPLEIKHTEAREKEVWGNVLKGNDPALFYGTPLYDLAKEMTSFSYFRSDEKIAKLIAAIPKQSINLQNSKFKETIGQFALTVGNQKAVMLLLEKGLNPNLIANELANGRVLIIDINMSFYNHSPEGLETLEYMIKKGANVNLYSRHNTFKTPLLMASSNRLENVKILIKAGADPHFTRVLDWGAIGTLLESPLSVALDYGHIDIVNYLIFDQKVNFRMLKYPKQSKYHPNDYIILYKLREMFFDLNSKNYQEKMKLVAYLKGQGLDYWSTPVPERFRNRYTKEYLSKY